MSHIAHHSIELDEIFRMVYPLYNQISRFSINISETVFKKIQKCDFSVFKDYLNNGAKSRDGTYIFVISTSNYI